MKILFIANNNLGDGFSGGDRIFTEFLRHWRAWCELALMGSEEALSMVRSRVGEGIALIATDAKSPVSESSLPSLFAHIVRRTVRGLRAARRHCGELRTCEWVYSVSDAYADFLPALWLKLHHPSMRWIAGYYLFAPPPWARDTPYRGRHCLRGLFYWLMQRPSYWLVKRYADVVLVTSEPDVSRFVTRRRPATRVIVVQGGVDITASEAYLSSGQVIPVAQRRYDACFVGRFHFQKGVLLLPEIWQRVCAQRPRSRLAMIGCGQLEPDVRRRIEALDLDDNIDLLGFRDGQEKHEVFMQSKMMVHPATYDSGGMAAAEGLAWGLPGVSFDLEALKSYYPRGMLKVPCFDLEAFAQAILRLMEDATLYEREAGAARDLITEVWDWRKRARLVFSSIFGVSPQ
ncbi:MAG: glycosyltransferase family 4 protein [Kiritimatiellae bacterium]|nr:glycosyltransferase family 4 protein [Kiritimatiellia bacterium]